MFQITSHHNFKKIFRVLSANIIFMCLLCFAGSASAVNYGAEGNPTGNPIGGGAGYSNILTAASADYLVSDKAGLLSALSAARSGQVIYIDDNARIDITDVKAVKIWPGVTLASGRGRNGSDGALLYETGFGTATYHFWIGSGGTVPARVTGLRLIGSDQEIGDQEGPYIYGSGIHCGSASLEVDNCELSGWGNSAVELAQPAAGLTTTAYVHHNYFHHNRRNGLGYGLCLGSSTDTCKIIALAEANLFDAGRHYIAAHGNPGNIYTARYNLCLEHEFSHAFDMHGGTDRGDGTTIAGDSVTIYCNTFRDSDETGICIRGVPRYTSPIYNNWFYHASANASPAPVEQLNATGNLAVSDNAYGTTPPAGTILPTAVPQADRAAGTAPLTVHFDGSASYPAAGSLVDYQWFLGDSSTTIGSTVKGAQADYTFTAPGTYDVVLQVRDSNGVPARNTIPVTVYPSTSSCVLSFWVKDSYRGSVSGAYVNEALIDGNVVWSSDVAGDDGWVHVVQDISAQVYGKSRVTLMLRTRCKTGRTSASVIKMLYTYWDAVSLSGFDTQNGGFEAPVSAADWAFSENGSGWDGRRYTGEMRSGYAGYRICYLSNTCSTDASGQISQTLSNPAPTVTGRAPQGSALSVSTAIAVGFSEPMDRNTAQTAFSIAPAVSGSFSWSGNTMAFQPSAPLQYGTAYTVTIGTGAADLAGNGMAAQCSWSFVTAASTATPKVTAVSPTGSAVAVSTGIAVGFSEAMDQSKAQTAFSISPSTAGSFSWSGNTMIFKPALSLQYGTTYTVTIGTGALDLAGKGLPAKYTWSFVTALSTATLSPAVIAKAPTGTGISITAAITAGFNEAMNKSSVQSAFSVYPSVSGKFSWSGNTMTFKPSSSLKTGRTYTVTISAAAKDLAGKCMTAACSWQFTTQSSLRRYIPGRLADGAPVSGTIALAADISGFDGVAEVDYCLDNIPVKTVTAPPFTWNWDSDSVPCGIHVLRITVIGVDGDSSEETMTVKVVRAGREEVYPNPYVKGKSSGGKITLANLPASSTVRIYTVAGDLVAVLPHEQPADGGSEEWDISAVPGGIYFYSITAPGLSARNGKIGIVK